MARKAVPGFAIVNDDIYEGSESFVMTIEFAPGLSADLVQFANPDGTTCIGFSCVPEYEVTITDVGDLPVLSLSVDPPSIAEEDDDGTTSVAENVSTVTVGITNGKTFAVDKTATLTFSGTATQGTHYSVSPGDADSGTGGHQVVLAKETASVEVTVTAVGNDTADGPRTVTVKGTLGAKDIGSSRDITILDDETTTTAPAIVTDGVQVTSTPATGDTYGLGEPIEITVTFDTAVTVDTSGGTPRIRSVLNGGGTPVDGWAEYSSGSGGTALVFTYTVQAGDMDDDGIWLPANSLELQGGTISAAADTTVAATLTYAQPGTQSEHKVDGGPTLSTDATLSALALSGVTLDPTFVSATEDYTATVGNAVTETTVTATPTHSGATVAFKDGDDTALTNPVTLAVGATVIKAVVTAEDTTTMKTYMVTVTRETTTTSDDATLSALALSGVTLDPTFASATEDYTATVGNAVTETTVTATPTHSGATVAFKDGDDNALTNPVTLAVGANVIKAVVTAEDTTTMKTYMVTVTREATTTTTAPAIVTDGVQVTSTPMATTDTYGLGETIEITVTFDKAVTVDTSGGTPRIQFRLDGRSAQVGRHTAAVRGTALVFTYRVQAGDMDADGIRLPANFLRLQSGTIRDATDNTVAVATLTYAAPGLQSRHKVDGSLTTNPRPAIVTGGVQVTSTPMATGDTYGLGETIEITVTFDKAVTVDTSGGTPRIAFRLDGDPNPNRWAEYSSGSGGTALVFTYTVQADDMDDDGIRLPANTIQLFSGTIVDATDPIVDATLTYAAPGLQSGHKVDGSLITTIDDDDETTTTPPAIVTGGVQVTSTPMATGDTYGLGETIKITVTFDNAVTVDTSGGTPRIAFRLDGDLLGWAEYSSGSGGTALMFTYTVLVDDMAVNGILLAANTIQLFGGTIRDATDPTVDATLTYAEPGLQSGHKVNGLLTTNLPVLSVAPARATEGTPISFTVTLRPMSSQIVTVDYATSVEPGDTAVPGTDYTETSGAPLRGWRHHEDGERAHGPGHGHGGRHLHADVIEPVERDAVAHGGERERLDLGGYRRDRLMTTGPTMTTGPRPRRPRSSPAACRSPRRRWPRATPTGWARPSQSRSPSTRRSRWTRPAARPGSRSASTGIRTRTGGPSTAAVRGARPWCSPIRCWPTTGTPTASGFRRAQSSSLAARSATPPTPPTPLSPMTSPASRAGTRWTARSPPPPTRTTGPTRTTAPPRPPSTQRRWPLTTRRRRPRTRR